jgi:hypothetical protein
MNEHVDKDDKLAVVVNRTGTLKKFLQATLDGEVLDIAIQIIEEAEVAIADYSEDARDFVRATLEERDDAVAYAHEMEYQRDLIADEYGTMANKLEQMNGLIAYYEEQFPAELFSEAADMTVSSMAEAFAEITGQPMEKFDDLFNGILSLEIPEDMAIAQLVELLSKAVES